MRMQRGDTNKVPGLGPSKEGKFFKLQLSPQCYPLNSSNSLLQLNLTLTSSWHLCLHYIIHPPTYSSSIHHPPIHLSSHPSSIHPPIYSSSIHPLIHSSTHPSILSSTIHPSIHPFVYPSTHPFIHPFIYLFIHPFIHPSIHPAQDIQQSHPFIIYCMPTTCQVLCQVGRR